jgi:hypothetical protein
MRTPQGGLMQMTSVGNYARRGEINRERSGAIRMLLISEKHFAQIYRFAAVDSWTRFYQGLAKDRLVKGSYLSTSKGSDQQTLFVAAEVTTD